MDATFSLQTNVPNARLRAAPITSAVDAWRARGLNGNKETPVVKICRHKSSGGADSWCKSCTCKEFGIWWSMLEDCFTIVHHSTAYTFFLSRPNLPFSYTHLPDVTRLTENHCQDKNASYLQLQTRGSYDEKSPDWTSSLNLMIRIYLIHKLANKRQAKQRNTTKVRRRHAGNSDLTGNDSDVR